MLRSCLVNDDTDQSRRGRPPQCAATKVTRGVCLGAVRMLWQHEVGLIGPQYVYVHLCSVFSEALICALCHRPCARSKPDPSIGYFPGRAIECLLVQRLSNMLF